MCPPVIVHSEENIIAMKNFIFEIKPDTKGKGAYLEEESLKPCWTFKKCSMCEESLSDVMFRNCSCDTLCKKCLPLTRNDFPRPQYCKVCLDREKYCGCSREGRPHVHNCKRCDKNGTWMYGD